MTSQYTIAGEEFLKEIFISYHIGEEFLIAFISLAVALRAFMLYKSTAGELGVDKGSRVFLVGSAFTLLGINSLAHAFIHIADLNLKLLYQTLFGYCLGLLTLIVAVSSEKPWKRKLFPLLYIPLLILLFPEVYEWFPHFIEFRPLVWLVVAYLSGIVCMLYIATYYRTKSGRFIFSAAGHALICVSAVFLFFPAEMGSRIWLYGHVLRPFGFGILFFSMDREELTKLDGSILYRMLAAFSLLAAIPMLVYGTVVFYENISPLHFMQRRMTIFLLLLITLTSALLFGLGMIIRLIRPILYLKNAVGRLADERLNSRIDVSSNDEIGELSDAFNDMVVKLRNSISEQDRLSRLAATGELAATLAHEIKNPLNAIGGAATYIEKNYSGSLIKEFLKVISEEVLRINKLTTVLLNFAKPLKAEPAPTDLNSLVTETVALMSQEAKEQRVGLRTDLDGSIPVLQLDYSQMKQVIINLLVNAFDAVNGEGDVLVRTYPSDGNVILSVEDNGTGIREENLEHIFNPFFTTKTRGTGLGLAISKKIIKEHGGDILVESAPEKGSIFSLVLPVENESKPVDS